MKKIKLKTDFPVDTGKKEENNKKILIVEDEEALSSTLSLKLESAGFKTFVAVNGIDALEMIKNNKYDLVLLDLMLPGKDGFEVLQDLHNDNYGGLVIVLSNLSQEEDIDRVLYLGAKKFLVKSKVQLSEIVDNIKELLHL